MDAHFTHLFAHELLILLHHSFAIPKLHYLLCTAPCFLSNCLEQYDSVLRSITSSVTNTPLVQNKVASLPVRLGGLGVRHALQVAPFAYLSSLASMADLVSAILPTSHQSLPVPSSDIALTMWSQGHSTSVSTSSEAFKEKNWDGIITANTASSLLEGARSKVEHARLLAARNRGSGAWLQALPISSVGHPEDRCGSLTWHHHLCPPHLPMLCSVGLSTRYSWPQL